MKNKTVVFGSNGFIAKSLKKNVKNIKDNYVFLSKEKYNLLEDSVVTKIKKIIRKNDKIIFISAIAPVSNNEMFINNILMLNNFIKSINDIHISHLIYISSDAVYEDSKNMIKENSSTNCSSLHGMMHAYREKLLSKSINEKKYCILRPTLIFGKDDTHNGYGPNKFVTEIKKNNNIRLYGKGEELRDHIHIDEVITVIRIASEKKLKGIYNLSTGKCNSFLKIAKYLINITKSNSKIVFQKRNQPMPHLGIRKLSNKKIMGTIKNFKIDDIKVNLKKLI